MIMERVEATKDCPRHAAHNKFIYSLHIAHIYRMYESKQTEIASLVDALRIYWEVTRLQLLQMEESRSTVR